MHYYRRNIGDYAKKAGRLSILQHGVYNLLLDACYDRERFPTMEEAKEWVWASTKEEIEAVEFVLKRFFEFDAESGTYIQSRIVKEIAEYQDFCAEQAAKGKKGGRPRKPSGLPEKPSGFSEKADGKPPESRREPEKTLTTNHYPLTTKKTREPFRPPSLEEVQNYCLERRNGINAQKFIDHYETVNWYRGKNKIKDWKACIRTWEGNSTRGPPKTGNVIDNMRDRSWAEEPVQ